MIVLMKITDVSRNLRKELIQTMRMRLAIILSTICLCSIFAGCTDHSHTKIPVNLPPQLWKDAGTRNDHGLYRKYDEDDLRALDAYRSAKIHLDYGKDSLAKWEKHILKKYRWEPQWPSYESEKEFLSFWKKCIKTKCPETGVETDFPGLREGMTVQDALNDLEEYNRYQEKFAIARIKAEHMLGVLQGAPALRENCDTRDHCDWTGPDIRDACYDAKSAALNSDWKYPERWVREIPQYNVQWVSKNPKNFTKMRQEDDILIQNEYGAYVRHSVTCYFNMKTGRVWVKFKRKG